MKKLIQTAGTKYAQNLQEFAIVDTKQTDGKPIMVSADVLEEAFENASAEDKAAFEEVIHFDVEGEEITVNPTTSKQTKTPSKGHNAITKVTVNAVTSAIDENIVAGNIKKDVTILGVTGTCAGVDEPFQDYVAYHKYKRIYFKTNPEDITLGDEAQTSLDVIDTDGSNFDVGKCFIKSNNTKLGFVYVQFSTGSEIWFTELNLGYTFVKSNGVWSVTEVKCLDSQNDVYIPGDSMEIVLKDAEGLKLYIDDSISTSENPIDYLLSSLLQVKESDRIEEDVD